MKNLRTILVLACLAGPILACNLLTTPATQAPLIIPETINIGTSVARTLAFESAVQTAVASAQPQPATQGVILPTLQPPAPTLEPTPGAPNISASIDTNCRKGPGQIYEAVSYLLVGKTSEVVNQYQNGTWWVIKDPNNPSQRCWVWGQTTLVTGNWKQLPEATQPPTPTGAAVLVLQGSVNVDASPDPDNYTGPCPVIAHLSWGVHSSMATTIGYNFLPGSGFIENYTFAGAGWKTWNYNTTINASGNYWEKLEVVSPVYLAKQVNYTVTCTP